MANMTKANLNTDIKAIMDSSGSPGGMLTNITNYVWDCFVTQPAATAPTTGNESTAMTDTITTANSEFTETFRVPNLTT